MIKGEKIYLRPILKEDIVYLNEWKNDEETYKWWRVYACINRSTN